MIISALSLLSAALQRKQGKYWGARCGHGQLVSANKKAGLITPPHLLLSYFHIKCIFLSIIVSYVISDIADFEALKKVLGCYLCLL